MRILCFLLSKECVSPRVAGRNRQNLAVSGLGFSGALDHRNRDPGAISRGSSTNKKRWVPSFLIITVSDNHLRRDEILKRPGETRNPKTVRNGAGPNLVAGSCRGPGYTSCTSCRESAVLAPEWVLGAAGLTNLDLSWNKSERRGAVEFTSGVDGSKIARPFAARHTRSLIV
jgi:hypothetical protein